MQLNVFKYINDKDNFDHKRCEELFNVEFLSSKYSCKIDKLVNNV